MRRLFLTGPIGYGKSTAIEAALGDRLPLCGGFRTRRGQLRNGHPENFLLESPDGSRRAVFLDFSRGAPEVHNPAGGVYGKTCRGLADQKSTTFRIAPVPAFRLFSAWDSARRRF